MRYFIVTVAALTIFAASALAGGYNYIDAALVKKNIERGSDQLLVDICKPAQFAKGHVPGSMETNAYPVKSDEERARLDKVLPEIFKGEGDVVVVCPGGGGGAKRAYEYLKEQGVPSSRLKILTKGMNDYPYRTESK